MSFPSESWSPPQLDPVDWSQIERESFTCEFCNPCLQRRKSGNQEETSALREKLQLRLDDDPFGDCPAPIQTFEELDLLPEYAIRGLQYCGITSPLPIQAQALPLVLCGRDVIGLAQTGSGKTLAYLLPGVVHMEAQDMIPVGDITPILLVLVPTRELAVQIADEALKVLWYSNEGRHESGIHAVGVYGGGDKRDQMARLRRGAHIVSATPGRLIDLIQAERISLARVSMLVLDEADRMLDMGFHGDVSAISGQIRPERQVLFFSATWSNAVQTLAKGLCQEGVPPVRISYGQGKDEDHCARESITQRIVVVDHGGDWERQAAEKRLLLESHLREVLNESTENKVLVFVSQKQLADDLAEQLTTDGFKADAMHGGRSQSHRLWTLDQFKKGYLRLLVCTDVLGRGIDIPSVSHVVVHEMGLIEDYVHRIGRTARGLDRKGHALVFFEYWEKTPEIASQLIEVLKSSNQEVPPDLQRIADEVRVGKRGFQTQFSGRRYQYSYQRSWHQDGRQRNWNEEGNMQSTWSETKDEKLESKDQKWRSDRCEHQQKVRQSYCRNDRYGDGQPAGQTCWSNSGIRLACSDCPESWEDLKTHAGSTSPIQGSTDAVISQ